MAEIVPLGCFYIIFDGEFFILFHFKLDEWVQSKSMMFKEAKWQVLDLGHNLGSAVPCRLGKGLGRLQGRLQWLNTRLGFMSL